MSLPINNILPSMTVFFSASQCGKIEFHNVVMRYDATLEPVLKSVSFSVKHGQKIGQLSVA